MSVVDLAYVAEKLFELEARNRGISTYGYTNNFLDQTIRFNPVDPTLDGIILLLWYKSDFFRGVVDLGDDEIEAMHDMLGICGTWEAVTKHLGYRGECYPNVKRTLG